MECARLLIKVLLLGNPGISTLPTKQLFWSLLWNRLEDFFRKKVTLFLGKLRYSQETDGLFASDLDPNETF